MNKYQCHKKVEAFLVGKIEGNKVYSADESEYVEVPADFFDKHNLNQECYLVRYEDNYLSVSPRAVFKAGYSEIGSEDEAIPENKDWNPIETAPKDGKPVDLWVDFTGEFGRVPECYWCDSRQIWLTSSDESLGDSFMNVGPLIPTHWIRIVGPKGAN